MASPVIQFKRGAFTNLPGLRAGEPALTTDTFDLYVGIDSTTNNNKFFGSHRYWTKETSSKGSSINLVEGTSNGTAYVSVKSPDSLAGIVTYTLPGSQGINGTVLTNDGSGNLTWGSGSTNAIFSGISTFSDTTDNILGNPDTGAVQIDGGLGVNKNVTVGAGLSVAGESYFIGTATFYGGQINLGDGDGDNISVAGEFISNLVPNVTNTYDLGLIGKRWRDGYFSRNLDVTGNLNVDGNVTIGGTSVTLLGQEVFIKNKDIILGYTTSVTNTDASTDDTANHAGVAIASTVGSPLVSFAASGINTLPDTYKQLMWFKQGTLGFGTDAFAFNYGVAIGTTTMADGVRLAVGSGITMSDNSISATNGYFTNISASSISGTLSGTISTATTLQNARDFSITGDFITAPAVSFNGTANVGLAATLALNSVVLGTYTSGDYVASISSGNGLTGGTTGAGSTPTLAVGAGEGITVNVDDVALKNGTNLSANTVLKWDNTDNQLTNSSITDDGSTVALTGNLQVGGSITGTATTATRSTQVDTTATTTSSDYYLTFVDDATSQTGETIRVDSGIKYNPGTDTLTVPTIKTGTINASDGSSAITINDVSGNVSVASSLTVTGDLTVLGSQTIVNTTELKVEDNLIDLGLVNSGGSLVPPSVDANIDIGVLFNYYTTSAKKSGIFWDDSTGRIGIASDLTVTNGVVDTISTVWAPIEIGALWVNDCAGQSQVINCSSGIRTLENITVDGGAF
jgi:hypothetical protein